MLNEVIVVHLDHHQIVLKYDDDNHYQNHCFDCYYMDVDYRHHYDSSMNSRKIKTG